MEPVQAHTPAIEATARRLLPHVQAEIARAHGDDPQKMGASPLGAAGDVLNIVLLVLNALHSQGVFSPNPTSTGAHP